MRNGPITISDPISSYNILSRPNSTVVGSFSSFSRPNGPIPGAIIVREWGERERVSLEALGLSAREAEVVDLVTTGMPNVMIAEELHLAPGTVRKHLDNIYNKLGVRGRGALTAFVLDIAGR